MKQARIAMAFMGIFLAMPGSASSQLELVLPEGNKLISTRVDGKSHVAEFSGKTWITGTLVAKWPEGTYAKTEGNAEIFIKSEASAFKVIPYFSGYQISSITLENGFQALNLTVGRELTARFTRGEIGELKARGKFHIDGLQVGVDCDTAWARAKLLEAKSVNQIQLHKGQGGYGC